LIYKKFDKLNVAFGAEFRHENFQINQGQPESYNSYDINGNVVTATTPNNIKVSSFYYTGSNGELRPGASQVFPGFKPANAVDKGRSSGAVYADLEYDVTENGY
jgi:iron complex outermembrane receptor protein